MRYFYIFIGATLWFALLIPWNGWLDPDAFYHAKAAALVWQHGPIQSFPWLDLTLLGTHYADLHFGLHLLTAPLVHWFGLFNGLRVATILLSAVFVAVFALCLRWLKLPFYLFWTLLLATSHPLLLRLLLGKATPLALVWFMLGITLMLKRRPWLVAVCVFGFTLTHGGWMYLVGSVILLALGDAAYARLVQGVACKAALLSSGWSAIPAACIGAALGMLVHPNFPNNFYFTWTQLVTIGLGTPFQHVLLGNEWLPAAPASLLASLAPWVMLCLVGLYGLACAPRLPLCHERARWLTSLSWILAVLLALTFKSRRNVEYLVPLIALWCALLWSLVDGRKWSLRLTFVLSSLRLTFGMSSGRMRSASKTVEPRVVPLLIACLILVTANQVRQAWKDFHPPAYRDDVYRLSMSALSQRAQSGDRVFHFSWDEFPMLFAQDDRLRYISGLDPTFLYVASSTLSDAYREASTHQLTREQLWVLVHERVRAKFLFVSKARYPTLLDTIKSDSRYVPIADADDSATFEIAVTRPVTPSK